jgi:hypothetical protein
MGRPPKSAPTDKHLQELDFPAAWRLMFADGPLPTYEKVDNCWRQDEPPSNWTRWKNPRSSVEELRCFDDFIEKDMPLPARDALQAKGFDCIFFDSRAQVARIAHHTTAIYRERCKFLAERKGQQEKLRKACLHLTKALDILSKEESIPPEKDPFEGGSFDDWESVINSLNKYSDVKDCINKLPDIIDALNFLKDDYFTLVAGKLELGWRSIFIENIGYLWYGWTKRTPSTQNKFVDFIDVALLALGAKRNTSVAEVRTVIERINGIARKGGRPEWNRFDRLEKWFSDQR